MSSGFSVEVQVHMEGGAGGNQVVVLTCSRTSRFVDVFAALGPPGTYDIKYVDDEGDDKDDEDSRCSSVSSRTTPCGC